MGPVAEASVVVDGLDPVAEGDLLASVLLGGLALDFEDEVGAVREVDDVVWAVLVDGAAVDVEDVEGEVALQGKHLFLNDG
jgi:hypothetical protein